MLSSRRDIVRRYLFDIIYDYRYIWRQSWYYIIYRGEVCISLLSWLCCCARWISYSYCDGNPATSGLVTYSPPADDDFRTFGNRETCRWPGTQDLPETRRTTTTAASSAAVSRGVLYYCYLRVFFLCTPRPAHHLRACSDESWARRVIGRVRTLARVNVQFPRRTTTRRYSNTDVGRGSTVLVFTRYNNNGRSSRRAKNTGHGMRNEQMRRRLRRGCDVRTAKAFKRYDGKKNWLRARVSVYV